MIAIEEAKKLLEDYATTNTFSNNKKNIELIQLKYTSEHVTEIFSKRILAQDVISNINVPDFDNSAMDGYAFDIADLEILDKKINSTKPIPISLQVVTAGDSPPPLTKHTCVRIYTGAPIPTGANTVVPQELCKVNTENMTLEILAPLPKKGDHIRPKALNISKGDVIFTKGTKLGSTELTVLASMGLANILVYRKLKVGIIITGDELVSPGFELEYGKIYDSNLVLLSQIMIDENYEIVFNKHIKDIEHDIQLALAQLTTKCDIIISTGGISVGDKDFMKIILNHDAQILFNKVSLKPGKPFTFALYNGCPILALPGNPLSAYITCMWFALPFMQILNGMQHTLTKPKIISLISPVAFETYPRTRFIFSKFNLANLELTPLKDQSSASLINLLYADGAILVPANTMLKQGDSVEFWYWK